MSCVFDETYAVYDERFPRARKPHTCDACHETISVGHWYARVGTVFDGRAETVVRCLRCQAIHEHLRTLSSPNDEVWPDERLDCGEGYEPHWGFSPPPEIAALAFVTPAEMQARASTRQETKR